MQCAMWLAFALLPVLATMWLSTGLRSGVPESADLRAYLREPALPLGPNAWRACEGMPEHLFGRALYQGLLRTGLDFPSLALVGLLAALIAMGLWHCLPGRRSSPRALYVFSLAALLCSPAFGGDWLLVERGRVFLPVLAVLGMVWLLVRSSLWRYLAAMLVSLAALTSHETASLLWLAVVPLLWSSVRRLALWLLVHNAALVLCYDETSRPEAFGLLHGLSKAPQATLDLLARVMTGALPDLSLTSGYDEIALAGLFGTALLGATFATWHAEAEQRARRLPALCAAYAGLTQALAVAHAHAPLALGHAILRELAWGTWLLPVGVLAVWADVLPRLARRAGPVLAGAMLVLIAQDWQRGVAHLQATARVLRQTEALVMFADLGVPTVPASPRAAVVDSAQRAWLRRKGLTHDLPPVEPSLATLVRRSESAGVMLPPAPPALRGAIVRAASADLVLLLRQLPGGEPRLVRVAAPDVLEPGPHAAWSADLTEAATFVEGETLSAWAFDLRARVLRPLDGRFVWRAGAFVAVSP